MKTNLDSFITINYQQHHEILLIFQTPLFFRKLLSKKTITDAYRFVTDLFRPLNIKELLRNGRMLSIDELSRTVAKRFEAFWTITIDANNAVDPESDSESEDDIHSIKKRFFTELLEFFTSPANYFRFCGTKFVQ